MSQQEPTTPTKHDAAQMLAEAQTASEKMIRSSDSPRGFTTCAVLLISALTSINGLVQDQLLYSLFALFIPLLIWLAFFLRKRAKQRPMPGNSTAFGCYLLVIILATMFLRMWEASTWLEAAGKMVVCCAVLGFLAHKMRTSITLERVEDGNGQTR
ncbi:hypothetical protein AUR04nite_18210 [Glutamicibacter uratoxydans]|uniref:Uncharacterized protein n=1 Tax=Glutamicibacter uratoxydans TaxID=43667 RepID=A0A4Y4DLS6_GLUUR|nr:hypothetical protein [Glutamicibacter uratoxydans]GED06289.1 hypothetical protein AUR04nite_18210 [Glutamicibacter uratoxydans]